MNIQKLDSELSVTIFGVVSHFEDAEIKQVVDTGHQKKRCSGLGFGFDFGGFVSGWGEFFCQKLVKIKS